MSLKTLSSLEPGDTAIIKQFEGKSQLQSRLVEMGALSGIKIRMIKKTPFHGPLEVKIRSYHLSLRWQDAAQILVS
jgi:Fe2+ transport system protein FeoA